MSSSATATPQARRVAKVMWKPGNASGSSDLLTQQSLSEGDLEMEKSDTETLRECLMRSSKLMPAPARNFQDWNVGLLDRFSSTDVAT